MGNQNLFKTWLCESFRDDTGYLGDLARDVATDDLFPDSLSLSVLLDHLSAQGACDEALGTLGEAFSRFEQEKEAGA